MKLIVILFGCINSIDLDDGTNLLQTGILQHYAQGFDFDAARWKQWDGYHLYEGHGGTTECYPTLTEAIAKCDEAGDCGAIATQTTVCGGQYRVSHGGPHLAGPCCLASHAMRSWVRPKCVTPGGPTENGIAGGLKWDPGYVGTYRYYGDNCSDYGQTTTTTTACLTGICVSAAACGATDTTAAVGLGCNGKTDCTVAVTAENSGGGGSSTLGRWEQKDGYYVTEGHGATNECYPTLEAAQKKCFEAPDCHAVAEQSNWGCGKGRFRVTHGGPTFVYLATWETYDLRSWELTARGPVTTGPSGGDWEQKDGYYVSEGHGLNNECFPTLVAAQEKCLAAQDCHAVAFQKAGAGCSGQFRVTHGGPTFLYWATWQTDQIQSWKLIARGNSGSPAGCKDAYTIDYMCNGTEKRTAALTKPAAGKSTTLNCDAVPIPPASCSGAQPRCAGVACVDGQWMCGGDYCPGTESPGGETDVTDAKCFDADRGFGPGFSCTNTEMYCSSDSGDGLTVGACCQTRCKKEFENKKKNSNAENKGKSEAERKGKRAGNEGSRKKNEKERKKKRKDTEWNTKRDASETQNKNAEDERKSKRGWKEGQRKNERGWKQNKRQRQAAADQRERARKETRNKNNKKPAKKPISKNNCAKNKKKYAKCKANVKCEKKFKKKGKKEPSC